MAVRKRTSDPDAAGAVRETSRVCSFALTFFFSFYGTATRSGLSAFVCGIVDVMPWGHAAQQRRHVAIVRSNDVSWHTSADCAA